MRVEIRTRTSTDEDHQPSSLEAPPPPVRVMSGVVDPMAQRKNRAAQIQGLPMSLVERDWFALDRRRLALLRDGSLDGRLAT
jgi:hypothetical protein